MNFENVFHLLSNIFKETNKQGILIGGFAVNYYNVTRQTADIDFLILEDDFNIIFKYLKKEGYELDYTHEVFVKLKGIEKYIIDIDFMFVDKNTFNGIKLDSKEIQIANEIFYVPSLEHLIALKLHSIKHNQKNREFKDLPDIINLIKANNVKYKKKQFKDICLKYGTAELYNKIIKSV